MREGSLILPASFVLLQSPVGAAFASPAQAAMTPQERAFLDLLEPGRVLRETKRVSEEIVFNRSGAGAGRAVAGSADERALPEHSVVIPCVFHCPAEGRQGGESARDGERVVGRTRETRE